MKPKPKSLKIHLIALILVITIAPSSATTSLQQHDQSHKSHHHRHRHKHQFLTIDSNQIHDIREAFAEYRNTVNKDKLSFEEIRPLRHHHRRHHHSVDDEETAPATHQHQRGDSKHPMFRHKRLPDSARHSTTTTSTTPATDEYDYNDDDEGDRRANDDAHVQVCRRFSLLITIS
jgi:hypothetical protein